MLDFEFFGEPATPLFDVWHFLRNVRMHRRGERHWLDGLKRSGPTDDPWHDIVEEEAGRYDLSGEAVAATVHWYLARMAALLIERGNERAYVQPYLDDLEVAAELPGTA